MKRFCYLIERLLCRVTKETILHLSHDQLAELYDDFLIIEVKQLETFFIALLVQFLLLVSHFISVGTNSPVYEQCGDESSGDEQSQNHIFSRPTYCINILLLVSHRGMECSYSFQPSKR